MSVEEHDKLDKILDKLETIGEDVGHLKRAVHGDEKNKRPGLIDTDADQEKRISELEAKTEKLETWKDNMKYWIGKIAAGVSILIGAAWHLVKQRLGL